MKINSSQRATRMYFTLQQLEYGQTYRDVKTGHVWLRAHGGYVDLCDDSIVTRTENMPGNANQSELRFQRIECSLDVEGVK